MDRYSSWNNIASIFYATDKILKTLRSPLQRDRDTSVFESNYSTIIEILKIIGEHSPGIHKQSLSNFIGKSDLYSDTYRNLKKHVTSNASNKINPDSIAQALEIIRPVLQNSSKTNIEKILKIYEILKS